MSWSVWLRAIGKGAVAYVGSRDGMARKWIGAAFPLLIFGNGFCMYGTFEQTDNFFHGCMAAQKWMLFDRL